MLRRYSIIALVSAPLFAAAFLGSAAPASAAAVRHLPNGLTVTGSNEGDDLHVYVQGNPRVGDYVTLTVNIRVDNGPQFERSTAPHYVAQFTHESYGDLFLSHTISVQACRKRTLRSSLCTAWSTVTLRGYDALQN